MNVDAGDLCAPGPVQSRTVPGPVVVGAGFRTALSGLRLVGGSWKKFSYNVFLETRQLCRFVYIPE